MKSRTNNKIVFCKQCMGVLTPAQEAFCNDFCKTSNKEREAARKPGMHKVIWVYLNKNMIDLASTYKVHPYDFSHFFWSGHELVGVACFDADELDTIGDHESNVYDAWWREVGRLNIGLDNYDPKEMRDTGILSYLCDEFGLSTEKNVALAIGEMASLEGMESPIQLINSL